MVEFKKHCDFALFPCKNNEKIPATSHGYYDAKFNFDIKKHYAQGYNIALACAKSNLIVLDCDVDESKGYNGLETLQQLEVQLGKLPKTLTQSTPRGGRHYIFSANCVCDPIGKIGKDIDVKYNGYILIEPSSINGKSYKLIDGISENGNMAISELPQSWINYINKPNSIKKSNPAKQNYEKAVIDVDFQKMYDNCAFIRHCVDYASKLDEPSWHLFACILSSLSNGEKLFDYYSRPYPDYNPFLTKKKFQNAKKYYATCNNISSIFSDCEKCKYRKEKTNE